MKTKGNRAMADRVLELAQQYGVLHARDLRPLGIPREHLSRLCARGKLTKSGRGLYMLPDADVTEHHGLVEAAQLVPRGVVCLLSALRFHDIGTQAPFEVWLAIERRSARPRVSHPPLRVMRFSGAAFTDGVEEHRIEGVPVRVYSPAKTVADCFKYRNKIGLDVALEALREALRYRKCTADQLWEAAKVCRVLAVMRPYMEAFFER
ncbi:MAG TPA: type IV toxin-antitoxin system AbiEi family antitoxin domain-containing protein [Planctomycetota bacterium]|nr:type IV toxin-antitoxin system AbiEi family antitoxin domain-containing protein [Planctomycetota bacterium]